MFAYVDSFRFGVASAGYGYFLGGDSGSYSVVNDKLDFSSDTTTMATKAALLTAKDWAAGANSATIGYSAGGRTSGADHTAGAQGLDFSSDTTAQVTKGAMTVAKGYMGGTNSSTIAYFAGGATNNNGGFITTNDGLTFATDTDAMVTKGVLSTAKGHHRAANSSSKGYYSGGMTGVFVSVATTEGLDFSSDTTTMVTKGVLATVRNQLAGANSSTIGYFAGGKTGGDSTQTAVTEGLDFSSDTTAQVTKGALTQAQGAMDGANSATKAYFAGGWTGATQSDRTDVNNGLTFASDTTAQVTKGAITVARMDVHAFQAGPGGTQIA